MPATATDRRGEDGLPPPPRLRWVDPDPVPGPAVRRLREELGAPEPVSKILVRRGYGDPDAATRFLRPGFDALHPPGALPDMDRAVARVEAAIVSGETILIHGDYDADGVSAAALLVRGLEDLGGEVHGFVPHRSDDGYDLGDAGLRKAREVGASLIVTADCGVAAADAVRRAAVSGIDVVVTDHHQPPPELPPAEAVVDPCRVDAAYPFAGLAGSGVAFKLLKALARRAGRSPGAVNQHLDLVALGTVADLVPLTGENRVLVRAGLAALGRSRKPGLRALLERSGWDGESRLDADWIGYRLAPRLNAVGRVAAAEDGLRLLLTGDEAEARRLADHLEEQNRRRRTADRRVAREAEAALAPRYDPERDRGVVLWDDDWPPGVIGIAASRLVERLQRPVVLVSFHGETGRGSGRSVPGFPLHEALARCAGLLERHGGHRMAAGLEIRRENVEAFAERFCAVAREELSGRKLRPELRIDLRAELPGVDIGLARCLRALAPFGSGNPRPVLAVRDVRLRAVNRVGRDGRHLRAVLAGRSGAELQAVGFGMGERAEELSAGARWDAAFELREDTWRGRRRLQAQLRDVRQAGKG